MNNIRFFKVILFLSIGITLCLPHLTYAISQEREPEYTHVKVRYLIDFLKFLKDLNLTDDQKAAIKELLTETRDTLKPLEEQLVKYRVQFDETVLAEIIDTEKTTALIEEIVGVKSTITHIVLNAKLEISQILTSEQRQIILEKKREMREKLCEHFPELCDELVP